MYTLAANQTLGSKGALTLSKISIADDESECHPWLLVILAALLCLEAIFALATMMAIRVRYRERDGLINNPLEKC